MPDFNLTYRLANSECRKLKKQSGQIPLTPVSVLIGGNANLDFCKPGLTVAGYRNGFDPKISSLPYNSWIPVAIQEQETADFWVIWMTSMGASRGGTERNELDLRAINQAAKQIDASGATLILILPEPMAAEADPFDTFANWRQGTSSELRSNLPPSTIVLTLDHLQRQVPQAQWFAPRYWSAAKLPAHPDAMTYIGMFAAEVIAQLLRPRIKAIITDLDNTVWGGVVGDDGPENLALDPDGDGRSFVELQRMLVDLSDQGIPISVSSKNTDLQARRPFEERPEMVLGLNDIVYFEASWNAKHLAIQKIAQQLNLGLDAICFLDDSPHERAEARAFLPDLVVPELPEDPEQRVDFLRRSGLFMTPRVLEDDLKRVRSYRENARRQVSAEQSISIEDYLRDLEIKLIAEPLSQANLPRAASLIQKTNQFNLTLARTQKTELANLINDPTIYSHLYSVIDRFGDSGQVALLVAKPTDSGLKILEWVMSCRVFSRHIEHATLTHLGDWAKLNGHTSIIAPYEATDRNGLVADFLDAVGFSSDVDHGNAEFRGDVDLPIEHFAEITNQRAGTRDRTLQ